MTVVPASAAHTVRRERLGPVLMPHLQMVACIRTPIRLGQALLARSSRPEGAWIPALTCLCVGTFERRKVCAFASDCKLGKVPKFLALCDERHMAALRGAG